MSIARRFPALVARRRVTQEEAGEVTTEDDEASFTGVEVSLAKHCGDVRRVTEGFARGVGLPVALCEDLVLLFPSRGRYRLGEGRRVLRPARLG
jgi:hypothetical protein